MPVYKYDRAIQVGDEEDVNLEIILPDAGSTAHHVVDVPGDSDFEGDDNYSKIIGKGKELKKERTVIITQTANVDSDNENVRVNFKINDKLIVEHSNPKSDDANPVIKIKLTFI